MNAIFYNHILQTMNASHLEIGEIIQELWSGYGEIQRIQLENSDITSVIAKYINLTPKKHHPRGWNTSYSHKRKETSYEVEKNWYKNWCFWTNQNCKTPTLYSSLEEGMESLILLEDLNSLGYSIRKQKLDFESIKGCLKWLANFHAVFIHCKPEGLWEIGTYWNLSTRPEEFKKMQNGSLKEAALHLDKKLNQSTFQTFVHGDAKVANFCFSDNSDHIAAVDFQYVGGGVGIKDVAYFLGSCLSNEDLFRFEAPALEFYFEELKQGINSYNRVVDVDQLIQDWRLLYPIACADFYRFLKGWVPNHTKLNAYSQKKIEEALSIL